MNFTETLTYWYSINKRDFPWRKTKNPYNIWLSEIIMQQTQIAQGLPYYEAFVAQFPTVFDLANAKEEAVLKLWQGLGYYSRARNLHTTAKHIANNLKGKFPTTYDELLKLKGVGDYTASAIASICYDEKTAVVDGNVYRVLSRYFGVDIPINASKGIKNFKELAQSLLPEDEIGNYNQAIMDFGSQQCKPKSPNCSFCPLNNSCVALKNNKIDELPIKINKTKITKKYFNFIVFLSDDGKTVLEKRTEKGIWKNLYQFPLVETNKRLSVQDFQSNSDVKQLLNGKKHSVSLFNDKQIIHKLSHQHLYTSFWIININELSEDAIKISDTYKLPVPILISKFMDAIDF
ncbi:MAG: A/G-specific adenine glycosylase [Flavobacteriaceae bacterium]|nr:A/G-specific adenine glycosylase [Flavobacteriaceae bacterium]